jgi:hypothetical protein
MLSQNASVSLASKVVGWPVGAGVMPSSAIAA